MRLRVERASVVYAKADAIVNAANSNLWRGGGVCGAIFGASKDAEQLQKDCYALAPCEVGHSVITKSYGLNAPYVIHTVGPIYESDEKSAPLLASAYRSALEIADSKGLKSIAIPSISTGIFGYPIEKAAKIAIRTILEFEPTYLGDCTICLYGANEYSVFAKALRDIEK